MFRVLTTAALLVALLSGCFGLPEGSADTGDLVTIRYTVLDPETGEMLRDNQTASFDIGSGTSGLGLQLERGVRGHTPGETFDVAVRDDASLGFNQRVQVNRSLADIPVLQSASLAEFQQYVGPAAVNVTFPAYGIYVGRVTNVTATTVAFRIEAEDGQLDPVSAVGSVLETHVRGDTLTRTLNPVEGATFSIAPPGQFQTTPLGLDPGSYKVLGATADQLLLARSTSSDDDLLGRDLDITVTLVAVAPQTKSVPTEGNFGVRDSPQVNGDPYSAIGEPLAPPSEGEGHTH